MLKHVFLGKFSTLGKTEKNSIELPRNCLFMYYSITKYTYLHLPMKQTYFVMKQMVVTDFEERVARGIDIPTNSITCQKFHHFSFFQCGKCTIVMFDEKIFCTRRKIDSIT